jgi:hypothetical protein
VGEEEKRHESLISTSSRSWAPAGDMSFKRLNQKRFHGEHDRDEGESISQNARKSLSQEPQNSNCEDGDAVGAFRTPTA